MAKPVVDELPHQMVHLAFRAPVALAERLERAAAARCSSRSETVRQLVLAGLEAQGRGDEQ